MAALEATRMAQTARLTGRTGRMLRSAGQPVLAFAATLAVAAALLALGGHSPAGAFAALVQGAFGSWNRFVSFTLVQATPLLLAGLAVAWAFRAGAWNIGAEGQLHAGALAGVALAVSWPEAGAPALLAATFLAAAAGGAAWALIPIAMKTRLGVGEVITTLLMNFVALFLAQFLVQGPLRESRGVFNMTDEIPAAAQLPPLIPGTRLHVGFLVGLLIAGGLWAYLSRTPGGFRVRVAGASPRAAAASGRIDPARVVLRAFLASGAVAGLAGWIQVAGVTKRMYEGLSPGWGYTAIAVALLGRLHPGAIVISAVAFGALGAGGGAMQREAGIPAAWVRGTEALLVLALLAVDRGFRRTSGAGFGSAGRRGG